ncbi:MAG: carboxymuconolactone decarboxylase family protein [Deltaproteobacteria bacterium]|nr:carboxymuconolactone decarboxylase family protein [Deltaproteobacteria bacterium]
MSEAPTLEALGNRLPDSARDLRLNLGAVLGDGTLSLAQRWGSAITAAITARNPELRDAVLQGARAAGVDEAVIDDARAAAAIMGMNNIFYRGRHLIGKESYQKKPARLRMNRIAKPATTRLDFELFCIVASAITGCGDCLKSHEHTVIEGGLTEDHVHDALRIASVVNGFAVSLSLGA